LTIHEIHRPLTLQLHPAGQAKTQTEFPPVELDPAGQFVHVLLMAFQLLLTLHEVQAPVTELQPLQLGMLIQAEQAELCWADETKVKAPQGVQVAGLSPLIGVQKNPALQLVQVPVA